MNITLSEIEEQQILLAREKEEIALKEAALAEEKRRAESIVVVKHRVKSKLANAEKQKEAVEAFFANIKPEYKDWSITSRERTISEEAWTYVGDKKEVYHTEEANYLEYFISNGKFKIICERHEVLDPGSYRHRVKSNHFEIKVDLQFGSLARKIFGYNEARYYKNPNSLIKKLEAAYQNVIRKNTAAEAKVQAVDKFLEELTAAYPGDKVYHEQQYVSHNHGSYSTKRDPGYYNELLVVEFPNKARIIFRLAELTSDRFELRFFKEVRITQPEVSLEDRILALRAMVPMEK
jgi:hypothetical protein